MSSDGRCRRYHSAHNDMIQHLIPSENVPSVCLFEPTDNKNYISFDMIMQKYL